MRRRAHAEPMTDLDLLADVVQRYRALGNEALADLSRDERHALERLAASGAAPPAVALLAVHHVLCGVPELQDVDAAVWAYRLALGDPLLAPSMRASVELGLAWAELLRAGATTADSTADPVLAADRGLLGDFLRAGNDPTRLAPASVVAIEAGALEGRPIPTVVHGWVLCLRATTPTQHAVAADALRSAVALPIVAGPLRARLASNLAWCLLEAGQLDGADHSARAEADLASATALAQVPTDPYIRGTRTEVLVALGRVEEARVLAEALVTEAWAPDGSPRPTGEPLAQAAERHLRLAVVELAAGDVAAARAAVVEAERHGADPVEVDRVRQRFP